MERPNACTLAELLSTRYERAPEGEEVRSPGETPMNAILGVERSQGENSMNENPGAAARVGLEEMALGGTPMNEIEEIENGEEEEARRLELEEARVTKNRRTLEIQESITNDGTLMPQELAQALRQMSGKVTEFREIIIHSSDETVQESFKSEVRFSRQQKTSDEEMTETVFRALGAVAIAGLPLRYSKEFSRGSGRYVRPTKTLKRN